MARRRKPKRSGKFYTPEYLADKAANFNEWDDRAGVVQARLLHALHKRGWSANHLAWICMLSPGTVYNLLSGKTRNPTSRSLYWLSVGLGCKMTWLMGLEGSNTRILRAA